MEISVQLSDGEKWYHLPHTSAYIKDLNIIPNNEDFIEIVKDDLEEHDLLIASGSPFLRVKHRIFHKNEIKIICYGEYLK